MPDLPASDPIWQNRIEPVYALYAALLRGSDAQAGLGGRLLYAGELDENGCRLMRAANIAGAASLGATADPAALRHANRDGVADFLVTSLDEALRILKNEIRKRQTVSVAISAAPHQIVAEMRERGVLPDLLPPLDRLPADSRVDDEPGLSELFVKGAQSVKIEPVPEGGSFAAWTPAPPQFDALAMAVLPGDDHLNRRWLRLAPRYLGPAARRVRSLYCSQGISARLASAMAVRDTR